MIINQKQDTMSTSRLLCTALACLAFNCAFAQHDNNWYFGQWAGLNFSSGVPTALTDSALSTIEASSVMSDADGELLFYTNGVWVFNKNHTAMPNGFGLWGDHSSCQGALIIPRPGSPNRFYIFATDDAGGAFGLTYSEVDMTLDGGLGDVVSPNNTLISPVCEKIAAVYHANGDDIWIVAHHYGSNSFYSYLVTPAGVNPEPVISNAGIIVEGAGNSGRYSGGMAISPDGSQLAAANYHLSAQLFDFDTATGMISNAVTLFTGDHYGIAFSPEGNRLYLTTPDGLFQYQTDAADVQSTQIGVGTTAGLGAMRLGPDGKIYVVQNFLEQSVSKIDKPNVAGAGCDYTPFSTSLADKRTFAGLPAFITSPLYVLDIDAASNCSEAAVAFSFTATTAAESMEWDFGDGTTSTEMNPVHTYAAAGTYTVKVKAKKGIFAAYYTEDIMVASAQFPVANPPLDMKVCDTNGDGQAAFILSSQNSQVLGTQPADQFTVTYHTSLAEAEANSNPLADGYMNTSNPQTIYARVTANAGGCHAITSFLVKVLPQPVIDMQETWGLCEGGSVTITAPDGFADYEWSTGATTQSIQVSAPGQYTVTVFQGDDTLQCGASKTINVILSGKPAVTAIDTTDWTEHDNSITVSVTGAGDYEYSLDGIIYTDSPVFTGLEPGLYTVWVRDRNGCGLVTEEVVLLMYPKFFTPNGDGYNEAWRIRFGQYERDMLVYIYDRYGKILDSFRGAERGWDGTFNGYDLPSTDYWFVVVRHDGREHRGHFSMLR